MKTSELRTNSDINERLYITRDSYTHLIYQLVEKIKLYEKRFDCVYGVPRGGLIPAVYISYQLNIPLKTYLNLNENVLIVDDICDTGKTFSNIKKDSKGFLKFATLFKHKDCDFNVDFYVEENDKWIVFPYEND